MEANRFAEMQKDIPGNFGDPERIAASPALDKEQKIALLKQWEFDLRQLMVASEENMTDETAKPGRSAELLRKVRKALGALEGEKVPALSDAGGAPTKAGG